MIPIPTSTAKMLTSPAKKKMLPHCSFCGEPITADYYKHFCLRGRDYIICDDCLEEDEVDTYITAQEMGGIL